MKTAVIKTSIIEVHKTTDGITLEQAIERMLENGEPFGEEVARIYTERKDGIQPSYNIRTDRFEIALEGIDSVNKSYKARRENVQEEIVEDKTTQANQIEK